LAHMTELGLGMPRDPAKAVELYNRHRQLGFDLQCSPVRLSPEPARRRCSIGIWFRSYGHDLASFGCRGRRRCVPQAAPRIFSVRPCDC
jgi:hypothetical protein